MTADFPFHDGQRFLVDDDQFHVHTVMCRRKPTRAAGDAGTEGAADYSLVTAGGYPVIYQPDTGRFRIPILGCFADRRV